MNLSIFTTPTVLLTVCSCSLAANTDTRQEPIKVTSEVLKFEIAVAWEHYTDGGFQAYDAYTFQIIEPAGVAGKELRVLVGLEEVPREARLRRVGTRCTFEIDPKHLTNKNCYWGALKYFELLPEKIK